MPVKSAAKPAQAKPAPSGGIAMPIGFTDERNGASYTGCGESIEGGTCHRYLGHHGSHRLTLAKPVNEVRAAKAAAWNALTEDEKQAEFARRKQVTADRKAAARAAKAKVQVVQAAKAAPRAAAKRQSRVMGSGPVARTAPRPMAHSQAPAARTSQRKAAAKSPARKVAAK